MKFKLAIAIFIILLIAGCSGNITGEITKEDPIKIGVIAPMTGDMGQYGEFAQMAMEIALDDINHTILGRPVELIFEDSMADPKLAVTATRKLVEFDKVEAILGPVTSPCILASAPIAEENEVVMLTWIGSHDRITDAGDYIFRIRAANKYEAGALARYANEAGIKSIAALRNSDEWGLSYLTVFEKYFDGEVIIDLPIEKGQRDTRTELLKARESEPDALLYVLFPNSFVSALTQRVELGIDLPVLSTTIAQHADIKDRAGSSAEGIIFPQIKSEEYSAEFGERFEEVHGVGISNHAENAYDVVPLIAKAIEKAGKYESTAIKDALYEVGQDYHGVSGSFSFDENGDVERPVEMMQFKNLEPVHID